jgi:PPE-repeat protein
MPDLEYYKNLAAELNAADAEDSRNEAVGRKTISNLFFDENSMLEYLAEQRFPGDPTAPLRYSYVDGDLVYEDENGNLVPEFGALEDASMIEEYLIPNIVPATTLAADITGGIIGAGKGFAKGVQLAAKSPVKHPLAQAAIILGSTAAGGFAGNLVVGGLARTGRKALLDSFYNTPPEELAAAQKDLLVSSAFSAIPFGAGPATQIMNKFRGKEDSLQYLINLRKDMQGTIDEAARMGIELTPAEAAEFATRAVNLQFFLSRQPQLTAIKDFYQSRARRIADAVETYATKIGSQVPGRYGSANDQVKAAAQSAMKEINQKRKDRAARLYSSLEGEIEVDISPLVTRLDGIIGDLKQSQSLRAEAQRFKDSLFDEVGGEMIPVSDLMALHRRRVSDLELIVKDNLGNPNANTVIGLREDLTALMDAADASGTYNLARRVYDPTKASLQLIEQSAIGKIANMVTDKQNCHRC